MALRGVNRVLTGLAGLVLVALGAAVLVGSLDLQRRWGFTLPSAWPFDSPGDVLLGRADRRKWRAEGWWWPAVIAALAVVVLLALWWLLAQLRRARLREVLLNAGDGEPVVVRGSALEEVLSAEAESSAGVERALVVLRGRRVAPEVRVGLTLAPHGSPVVAVRGLSAEVLAHARASTGLPRIPAEVRVGVVRHRAERVG